MSCGGLCPRPTFHAWVTIVRKKCFSLYYSTYGCFIHQTCTNCSSWHDLLVPGVGLCAWPTFHASVTKTQNGTRGAPVMVPITIMSSYTESWSTMLYGAEHCAMRHDHETMTSGGKHEDLSSLHVMSLNQSYFFIYRINYVRYNTFYGHYSGYCRWLYFRGYQFLWFEQKWHISGVQNLWPKYYLL